MMNTAVFCTLVVVTVVTFAILILVSACCVVAGRADRNMPEK